jgi:hypothetical protein
LSRTDRMSWRDMAGEGCPTEFQPSPMNEAPEVSTLPLAGLARYTVREDPGWLPE